MSLTERARQHEGTWLLVLALLAGLFGMHALVAPTVPAHAGMPAMAHSVSVQPDGPPTPSDPSHSEHGLGHLCLAVLTVLVSLSSAVLLLLRGAGAVDPLPRQPVRSRPAAQERERRPAAPFQLCVLRT